MRRTARALLYTGVLVVVLGLGQIHARFVGDYSFTGTSRFSWTLAYAGLLSVFAYGLGLPDLPRSGRAALGACVGAAASGAAAISVIQLVVGDALLPRFVVFGSALVLPDWYRLCVRLAAGERTRAEERDRVIVVGRSDEVETLLVELDHHPERPASIAASFTVAQAVGAGERRPLSDAFAALRPTVVVLDREAQDTPAIVHQAAELHAAGVRVRSLTQFYEEWLGKLPVSELERASMLFDIGEVHRVGYGRAKRLIDVPLALMGCLVLLLCLPFVWVVNRLANRGPLLYRQRRVGKGGEEFVILKLRTMVGAAQADGAAPWTDEADPRVTTFGRFLRRTHLDELPQAVNILRGDLSVVGPRPEQPRYVEVLSEKLPFYGLRHLVRPGLTGWAQVKYGYAGSERDALEKLQYDFWYLRHQSLSTDVRVIGRTVRSVLGSEGGGR